YEVSAPHEILVVAVPQVALSGLLEAANLRLAALAPLHADTHRDPFLEQLCHRLFEEAAGDNPLGGLFADHALVALTSALVRLAGRRAHGPPHRAGLPSVPLRRVLDHLHDNLAEDVSLSDLAALAHMSVFHFARTFRESVGEAPHRYVIRQRVERAKGLI